MPTADEASKWAEDIRERYVSYLKTLFYFKDSNLRESFARELQNYELMKGPYPESAQSFAPGERAEDLAKKFFPDNYRDLLPALIDKPLYEHQEKAIHSAYEEKRNIVVATGTASGKTESFLYPILFELYRQHIEGQLGPGVRALILYPMNALANDQRERLGEICQKLKDEGSSFAPKFGQYIGTTPENKQKDRNKYGEPRNTKGLAGESVYRDDMRQEPPHILLTNYSMLEYLLIRPQDSELFDEGRGKFWQFLVLDEAHQYRGVRGMEMSMLMRRLKQRLRDGGQNDNFRCIATSATISDNKEGAKEDVARFANSLFGEESYCSRDIIFSNDNGDEDNGNAESEQKTRLEAPLNRDDSNSDPECRHHLFIRALEGAFMIHKDGVDSIVFNRTKMEDSQPLEIALCRDCGQHYYVGYRNSKGYLAEAERDPGDEVQVEFYLPLEDNADEGEWLCRVCGKIGNIPCSSNANIKVRICKSDEEEPDQLERCAVCEYDRGNVGDPVQEIVHGTVGPNAVIATAWHGLLAESNTDRNQRKILSFADSRQDAAFFAWYVEDTHEQLRNRNLIWRAFLAGKNQASDKGLWLNDLLENILKLPEIEDVFSAKDKRTSESKIRKILTIIFQELVISKRRMALSGVGLVKWGVEIPEALSLPNEIFMPPWNFDEIEARELLSFLLDDLRYRRALSMPEGPEAPSRYRIFVGKEKQTNVRNEPGSGGLAWTSKTSLVAKFMKALCKKGLPNDSVDDKVKELMNAIWDCIQKHDSENPDDRILKHAGGSSFHLNNESVRGQLPAIVYKCKVCANISVYNIRNTCPRCGKELICVDQEELEKNYYRILYQDDTMPMKLRADEHTAQIKSDKAQDIQRDFKEGKIDLLSTSTTFEVGVDLGELEAVFLRNVPPEPYNYTQRVGRVGRRDKPGMAITYCRRSSHDLYHYQDPVERILLGETRTPRLNLKNPKIILRHMTAVALSRFFKCNVERFRNVKHFIGCWDNPVATSDFELFCHEERQSIENTLKAIVPCDKHRELGLLNGDWIKFMIRRCDDINGGRCLETAEMEACNDYNRANDAAERFWENRKRAEANYAQKRAETIEKEDTLSFLSHKAIIPRYGFPVDVVELDVSMSGSDIADEVLLQRELSQAIAEYAPGSKIVAHKKEWESCGFKVVRERAPRIVNYDYDAMRIFKTWNDDESPPNDTGHGRKYLCPEFGFATSAEKQPRNPSGQPRRVYTTRPFFHSFKNENSLEPFEELEVVPGVKITQALPGKMVVLCEGRNRQGFFLCKTCGRGFNNRKSSHKDPYDNKCRGSLHRLSLGHEFPTDIVRIKIPGQLFDEWTTYSIAYAILLGSARALDVPDVDLSVTITGAGGGNEHAIILYDNVPGGAGLVADLINPSSMINALKHARERVKDDGCGCDESCYGCLRSYRNQFAHPHLRRKDALRILDAILDRVEN